MAAVAAAVMDVTNAQRYEVPSEAELDGEFTAAPDIERIAGELIARHRLTVQANATILYLWRDKGGRTQGKATYGKCSKASGLVRHFSEADAVIWLAADHLREAGATATEVEAVVFHELCHLAENAEGELIVVGHDFQGFESELRHYGTTARDLRPLVHATRQLVLDLER